MSKYEDKYGFKETNKTILFHRSRRMFCIKGGKLYIAEPDLPYSHAVWFEKEKWITSEDDQLMNQIVRGFVDKFGNIHFYIGYDFRVTEESFRELKKHLNELTKILQLNTQSFVYGGSIKSSVGVFKPRKTYGKICDL
jgi:hypothetical protein